MATLKDNPVLGDFQRYVLEIEKERGLSSDIFHYALMLGEETGELFKAIRKDENQQIASDSKVGKVNEELVDVFIFICAIANKYGIDLEQAFRDKEAVNEGREWKRKNED
ncbi:MAG: MazG nucleotide pyrophosphohydrolase domain-containing protein [Candidatus Paceibacterota bacterium]